MTAQTDCELLEAAARAAELDCIFSGGQIWTTLDGSINKHTERWDPLANDGQALRLAAKLRIGLGDRATTITAQHRSGMSSGSVYVEEHGTDPYAATRRAIVRVAAAIRARKEGT